MRAQTLKWGGSSLERSDKQIYVRKVTRLNQHNIWRKLLPLSKIMRHWAKALNPETALLEQLKNKILGQTSHLDTVCVKIRNKK